jgi:hypothetical protein
MLAHCSLHTLASLDAPPWMVFVFALAGVIWLGTLGIVHRYPRTRNERVILETAAAYDRVTITENHRVTGGYTRTVEAARTPPPGSGVPDSRPAPHPAPPVPEVP